MRQQCHVLYYLILSAIGAALIIILSWLGSSKTNTILVIEKQVIGGVFIISCIFGIIFALKPNRMRRSIKRISLNADKPQPSPGKVEYQGHHPDCGQFRNHTITIQNKIYCAGCNGLALGSIISIFLMSVYIVFPKEIPQPFLYLFIILGMVFIVLNFIEIVIPTKNAYLHLILNVLLVISFFLIITGIFHLTGSMIYGISGVLLSFLWLDTRIQLSNWRHTSICNNCSESCKAY